MSERIRLAALGTLACAAVLVRRRVEREYEIGPEISAPTAGAVWGIYLANIALVADAAVRRRWQLPIPPRAASIAGWTTCAAGTAFANAGIAAFRSFSLMNGRRNDRLVTGGPYRVSRHPQNVGWAAALGGAALASRSAQALLGSAAMWFAFADYVPVEERHLRRVYGEEYVRYAARTRRFLGMPRGAKD